MVWRSVALAWLMVSVIARGNWNQATSKGQGRVLAVKAAKAVSQEQN